MKAYFLELNKQSSEFRSGFRHNFQETTFLTPSICGHCKKMVFLFLIFMENNILIFRQLNFIKNFKTNN